ncbi:MAG: adaptor protein MecA [Lachnospiraceae bacterium]|nr:adaptor protein MecA [Lachnospiraceae bacterium]
MKIEKISNNKIRCTLSGEDLKERDINVAELAYGTDKAKSLFQDMMERAKCQFGIQFDGGTLMIEAVSSSPDHLVLTITAVEQPDEAEEEEDMEYVDTHEDKEPVNYLEEIKEMIKNDKNHEVSMGIGNALGEIKSNTSRRKPSDADSSGFNRNKFLQLDKKYIKLYGFKNLDDVIKFCKAIGDIFEGVSDLYRMRKDGSFMLLLNSSGNQKDFKLIDEISAEYGMNILNPITYEAYLKEHEEVWIENCAVMRLSNI